MVTSVQIDRYRGDTVSDSFAVTNKVTGEIVNITGCTFKMTVSSEINPTDVSHQLYQIVGTIADAASGLVEFAPTAAQSDRVGLFYYDIEMIDGNGIRRTLAKDAYNYIQDITK